MSESIGIYWKAPITDTKHKARMMCTKRIQQASKHSILLTYFLQLKARLDFASRCFSAEVVVTLPVVGLLSICMFNDKS